MNALRVEADDTCHLEALAQAGLEDPRTELRALVRLAQASGQDLSSLIIKRTAGTPFAYLAGSKEFWSLSFSVSSGVLIPRPESELLVETALKVLQNPPTQEDKTNLEIIEFGLGSGAVLFSLLWELCQEAQDKWGKVSAIGIEKSAIALEVARQNGRAILNRADNFKLSLLEGDWGDQEIATRLFIREAQTKRLALANPPYLTTAEWQEAELHSEPRQALDGGADGLDAYRGLARPLAHALTRGEMALLEITPLRVREITACFAEFFVVLDVVPDLAGLPRVLLLCRTA